MTTQTINPKVAALLRKWDSLKKQQQALKAELAPINEKELAIRRELASYFENVVEGSRNTLPLAKGYSLKLTHKVKRVVDETALAAVYNDYREEKHLPMDILFKKQTVLEKAVYSKLPEDQKALIDAVIVVTNEAPVLEMVAPKESK